jgi:hypothetical protein
MRSLPVTIGLAATAALGCALFSTPHNTLAPGNEGAPGVKRLLVCAPNTVIALPPELQGATRALHEQIDAYLHFHERETQWLDLYDSKQAWEKAISAAKGKGPIEQAPVFFAAELAKHYEFDAIVMPSVFLHKTRATDGSAGWDGVQRRMEILNPPARPRGGGRNTRAEGVRLGGISGDVLVTSVHVLVFSRTGERIFEGRGGIGFAHDVDMSPLAKTGTFALRPRDITGDVDALREGIAIAFDPYLPPPEE